MKTLLMWVIFLTVGVFAEENRSAVAVEPEMETNSTLESNLSLENNSTKISASRSKKEAEALQKQMDREKKYAKEQVFYQGSEYDLSFFEIDQSSLDNIPLIEPDYDFNMDDVYD